MKLWYLERIVNRHVSGTFPVGICAKTPVRPPKIAVCAQVANSFPHSCVIHMHLLDKFVCRIFSLHACIV